MTMDPGSGVHGSLLIERNRIKDVGVTESSLFRDPTILKIDLRGKILLPGLIDNHTHILQYLKEEMYIDLLGAGNLKEIAERIEVFLKRVPESRKAEPLTNWIICRNLNRNNISDYRDLNRQFLDSVSNEYPIVLQSRDLHTRCCNTIALNLIGIDSTTPDPAGGRIGRENDGTPDGFLYEKAWVMVEQFIKNNAPFDYATSLSAALNKLYRYGLTSLHTMENFSDFEQYADIFVDKLRVCWHIFDEDIDKVIEHELRSYSGDEFKKFGTIKSFLDGALGSSTALLSIYDDPDSSVASLLIEEDEISDLLKKCRSNKLGLSFHSIGDRSTTLLLDIIDKLYTDKRVSPMLRLEHLQFVNNRDIERIRRRGIYCSLQPYHISFDIPVIEGKHRSLRDIAYPLKTIFSKGCQVGFGSDAPIADISPFTGIYSAITRKADLNSDNESWMPEFLVTPEQSIDGYTRGGSYGSGSQNDIGTLTPGKLADMIVIEDFRNKPAEFWLEAKSYLTIIDGKIRYNELSF